MDSSQSQKTKTSLKTLVVSFWTFISRIFGVLRDIATTYILGAGVAHDVFVVMLKIPNLFRRLVAEGAFSQAFIPVFTEYKNNQSKEELKKLIDLTFTAISSLVLFLCILFMIFAPIVVFIFAPGFILIRQKNSCDRSLKNYFSLPIFCIFGCFFWGHTEFF